MSLTPEQELAFLKMQQAQGGTVTGQGIRNWQTIIIFGVTSLIGVGGWLVMNTNKATEQFVNITRDINDLKAARESITQVKGDQLKTSAEVAELRMTVKSIQTGQEDLAKKMESVSGDVRAVGQQVAAISQSLRGRQ